MIGERLAEIRKDHGDRQADLAQKLHVTLYTVRSWEQEKSALSHEMLVRICRLYQVSSDYLLGLSDYDPPLSGSDQLKEQAHNIKLLREFESFLQQKSKDSSSARLIFLLFFIRIIAADSDDQLITAVRGILFL